jgi:hypothetical protein
MKKGGCMLKIGLKITSIILISLIVSACSSDLPEDFRMVVDARRANPGEETPAEHVFIEINQSGKGSYVIYDSGGAIVHDEHGMVVFTSDQILEEGTFKLSSADCKQLWQSIQDSAFFELTDDYRMSMGGAYAFVVVDANGKSHSIDNIGMDLPEIEKIIETLNSILLPEIEMEYSPPGPW